MHIRNTAAALVLISTIAPAIAEPLAVWRLFGPEHFYTTNCQEAEQVLDTGYVLEGNPAFYIETAPTPGTNPMYRFFNGQKHLYTTSRNAEGADGYALEGILGHIFHSRGPELIPLYRAYNPVSGDHLFTIGRGEYQRATQGSGYEPEGVVGYVPKSGVKPCSPTAQSPPTDSNLSEEEECFQCDEDERDFPQDVPRRERR